MSSWDFIVDNIRFSFSNVTSFETCRGGWKLNYIDKKKGISNFFAQYGNLVHSCMEGYFRGEIDAFDISAYYKNNYSTVVKASPPPYPKGMADNYKQQGQEFFDNFSFNIDDYDVLGVEETAFFDLQMADRKLKFITKPDLLLRQKDFDIVTLLDFKTSNPFRVTKKGLIEDKRKTVNYYKQLYIYSHAIRETMGINVAVIGLWFPRANEIIYKDWDKEEEDEVMVWLREGIENILKEEDFPFDNSDSYFCSNLCSVRHYCPLFGGKS